MALHLERDEVALFKAVEVAMPAVTLGRIYQRCRDKRESLGVMPTRLGSSRNLMYRNTEWRNDVIALNLTLTIFIGLHHATRQ